MNNTITGRIVRSCIENLHGRYFFSTDDTIYIGRDPKAHLNLSGDSSVSRQNLRITNLPDGPVLINTGKNAVIQYTYFEKRVIRQNQCTFLANGDEIAIGRSTFIINIIPENIETDTHKYRVKSFIGKGGTADVVLVEETSSTSLFALKMLTAVQNRDAYRRFSREIVISQHLNHPFVVRCIDAKNSPAPPFIIMPVYKNGNLFQFVKKHKKVPLPIAYTIMMSFLKGMAYLTAEAIVNRDVKPENTMLTENFEAILTDFGSAKRLNDPEEEVLTQGANAGGLCLTPRYMCPDGLRNARHPKPNHDLYNGVCSFYFLLSGGKCPRKDHVTPITPIQNHNPDLPKAIAKWINSSLTGASYLSPSRLLNELSDLEPFFVSEAVLKPRN